MVNLKRYMKEDIKRISPILKKLLCEESNPEFLGYMCYHPNKNIRMMVLSNNKNIPVSIAEDYMCFGERISNLFYKHYSNERYNENVERSLNRTFREELRQFFAINVRRNLPISTLLKCVEIDDFDNWTRCWQLFLQLRDNHRFLESKLNVPYTNMRGSDKKVVIVDPTMTRLIVYR